MHQPTPFTPKWGAIRWRTRKGAILPTMPRYLVKRRARAAKWLRFLRRHPGLTNHAYNWYGSVPPWVAKAQRPALSYALAHVSPRSWR